MLWKNGDTSKKIVVLTPHKCGKPEAVTVYGRGGRAESLQYAGEGNPDPDGPRYHWRGSKPVKEYQGKLVVEFAGETQTLTFRNRERVD
jgi:hypothetical protein